MIKLELISEQIPIMATIIESSGTGFFLSIIKRYLKDKINVATMNESGKYSITIDHWVGVWLLSTLYASEVDGAAAKLMYDLEDALVESGE